MIAMVSRILFIYPRRGFVKRVRYALGATAALAPAAVGMAPATVAHAATNVVADGSAKGKTVSLNHPSAPSAAPALSTCTASGETTKHVNSLIKSFIIWNIQKPGFVCIGTTEVKRFFKNKNSVNIRFVVSYGKSDSLAASRYLRSRSGLAGQTK